MADVANESEQSDIVSDPSVQTAIATSESVSWLSFDGTQGLSVHEFVQNVQRTAFQQRMQRDDEWVADFAATCFSGEALEWYIGLDEETQASWRRLRASLIQRWPIHSGRMSSANSGVHPANIPAPAPTTTSPHSLPPTSNNISLGVIKVEVDNGQFLGYVTLDAAGMCIIQTDAALALVVGRPQQLNRAAPCQTSIEGPENVRASIAHMPYLGLSLHRRLGTDPDTVHPGAPYSSNPGGADEPIPSSLCGIPQWSTSGKPVHPLATWYISPCSQDPPGPWRARTVREPSVPASAVFAWTFDPITLELGTTWRMTDGTLHDLETFVDDTYSQKPKLHMHRGRDVQARSGGWDDKARLFFTPI